MSTQWELFCIKNDVGPMIKPFIWWLNFNELRVESMQIQDFEREWREFLHEIGVRHKLGQVAAQAAGGQHE